MCWARSRRWPKSSALAHAVGAKVLIDGCQGCVHDIVDVQALDCDFYVTTGHKLYGPTGIGFLYGKYDLLAQMQPYQGGGEMIADVYKDKITYAAPPHRFEAGTPPIVEAIGLGVALDWMQGLDRAGVAGARSRPARPCHRRNGQTRQACAFSAAPPTRARS